MQRIEHSAHHCRKRHAGEIGEHDDRKLHSIVELYRIIGEARRNDCAHDKRHGEFHHDSDEKQDREKNAKNFFRKAACAFHAVLFYLLGKKRYEGRIECTFSKKPAERVREAEGSIERIRHGAGAECCCHEHFARKAENAAHQRAGRDRCELFDQTHLI